MKVLFCTDGSDASYYAIKKILPFLKAGYQIDILNVIDWGFFPTYVTFPHEEETGFENSQHTLAEKILNKTRDFIFAEGYRVTESKFSAGHPDTVILQTIAEDGYDIVVMGSHGKKGLKNWLGSVSRKVVTKSPIPVLIARPPKNPNVITVNKTKELLISADGSTFSYNAIKKAIELLNLENSRIELLTVRPGAESFPLEITMDNEWLSSCIAKQKEIADEILSQSKKIIEDRGFTVQKTTSIEGDPAEMILKYTTDNEKDLVIMGSHGREGVSDLLLGSVSKRVLDFATSPVLIVPTKK